MHHTSTHLFYSLKRFVAVLCCASLLLSSSPLMAQPSANTLPQLLALPQSSPPWVKGYQVRYTLRIAGRQAAGEKEPKQSAIAALPTTGWLKPDASDLLLTDANGQVIPSVILSHDPQGDTLVQFPITPGQDFYYAYAVNPAATAASEKWTPPAEGLVCEVRQWEGDNLDSWAQVRIGLVKSENVIGNDLPASIVQLMNPARPGQPQSFAASYRGYLRIPRDGQYRFFANAQDAVFLFIDGLIVDQRPGQGPHKAGRIAISSVGSLIDLKAGIHPIQMHHVMGTNPAATGFATLTWVEPGSSKLAFVPSTAFVHAASAQVMKVERPQPTQAIATIQMGIEDVLIAGSTELYLVRFEAAGHLPDASKLVWDFGDATTGRGASVRHVYFSQGDYRITLQSGDGLPAAVRHLHVWPVPGQTSPLTPGRAVESFQQSDWKSYDLAMIQRIYEFVIHSEQPNRWPLVEELSRHLLSQNSPDLRARLTQRIWLMRALGEQGKATEAAKVHEQALAEAGRIASLEIELQLAAGRMYERSLRQPEVAGKIYQGIIDKHTRGRHPGVRDAAIALGDLYLREADNQQAAAAYRLAESLDGPAGAASSTQAVTRGALLRVAEQRLREGNVRESGAILDKIAQDYPQQKLEGLYRFLRGETDRIGGRYEDAVHSYEILLKLDQWASFRPQALFGIADSHQRMGEMALALQWLDTLASSFPDYYEAENLANYRTKLQGRIEKQKAGQDRPIESLPLSFNPEDAKETSTWGRFDTSHSGVTPGLGIVGPGIVLVDRIARPRVYWDYLQPVGPTTHQGHYWVELWYRNRIEPPRSITDQHIHFTLMDDRNQSDTSMRIRQPIEVTAAGQWQRVGYLIKAADAQEAKLSVSLRMPMGIYEIDGLSITHVSDRTYDAFQNFVDGTPQP